MEKPVCSLAVAVNEGKWIADQNEFGDETVTVSNKKVAILQSYQNNYKDSVVNGAGGHTASAIFPPEVWEVILDEVVESEDIHNVLLAFPELDKAFQSKKAMWLFGAVLPLLMTKHLMTFEYKSDGYIQRMTVKSKDLFTLRVVSKRWKASVDSSLENHAALEHLPSPSQIDSKQDHQKIMLSENHFSYHRLPDSKIGTGASILRTDQQIDEFLTSMTNHPGNPFPGKSLAITLCNSTVDESLALFEKFGKHILFLEIDLQGGSHCHLQVCQNVLKCLSHVTNLRSLTFTGNLDASTNQQTDNFFSKPETDNLFPELPNLEAFKWHADFLGGNPLHPSRWMAQMIQKYGGKGGLGRLEISADQHQLVPFNLTNITELNLIVQRSEVKTMELVEDAFRKLSNPNKLRKLRLHTWRIEITKLLRFLTGYKVESLNLEVNWLREKPFEDNNESIPAAAEVTSTSITTLYFKDAIGLKYDFFKWLPNLQYLTIHFKLDGLWQWREP